MKLPFKLLLPVIIIILIIFANPLFYIYVLPVIYEKIEDIRYIVQYTNLESTDLSNEHICGINLKQHHNPEIMEKMLGKVAMKIPGDGFETYEYVAPDYVVDVKVTKKNEIIAITLTADQNDLLKTQKDITIHSSLSEVIKAYGGSYIKKKESLLMALGENYSITYFDKQMGYSLIFAFNEYQGINKMTFISFLKD